MWLASVNLRLSAIHFAPLMDITIAKLSMGVSSVPCSSAKIALHATKPNAFLALEMPYLTQSQKLVSRADVLYQTASHAATHHTVKYVNLGFHHQMVLAFVLLIIARFV